MTWTFRCNASLSVDVEKPDELFDNCHGFDAERLTNDQKVRWNSFDWIDEFSTIERAATIRKCTKSDYWWWSNGRTEKFLDSTTRRKKTKQSERRERKEEQIEKDSSKKMKSRRQSKKFFVILLFGYFVWRVERRSIRDFLVFIRMSLIFPSFKANDQTSIGSFAGPGPLVPAPIFNPFDYSCNGYFGNVYPNSNGFFPFPPLNSTIVPFQKSFPLDTTVQNVLSQDCSVKPRRDPLSQKEEKRSGRFELNPRASEFSSSERKSSSLIFEQLVEKSLDSLEAIRIGSK